MSMIRVMTFNVNGAWDEPSSAGNPNIWSKRATCNVETIQGAAADLMGFQEVEAANWEYYQRCLSEYSAVRGNEYDVAPYAATTSIFWKTSRFELIESGEFWLSETPDEPSGGWGVPYPMGVTWIKVRCVESDVPLVVLNTHLEDGVEGELFRVESSKLIVERVGQLQVGGLPVVLMGDFNCNPDSETHRIFSEGGFTDTYLAAGNRDGRDSTVHLYEGEQYSAFHYSGGANTFWRIDWILMRDGVQRWQTRSCSIVRDAQPPLYPSDHYPVVAELLLVGA
jgi:endonuclease/exonuclease/phosphatase family metal-dependent hydrolase